MRTKYAKNAKNCVKRSAPTFCCFVIKFIENTMNTKHKIIVVGGYGAVGQYIGQFLHDQEQFEVVIAGRSLAKAEQYAARLPQASARFFDLDIPDYQAIEDASLLILCVESKNDLLAAYCLSKGIHYIDITANNQLIDAIEQLKVQQPNPKSMALLSVGLAPGISNLLAKHCINHHLQSEWVDIDILLGLGEKHGYAAFEWTFDNMHRSYSILEQQHPTLVKSFSRPKWTAMDKKRRFFLFNFSDQHSLASLWPTKNIKTRLAFDSFLITELLFWGRNIGLTKVLQYKPLQRALHRLFHRINLGTDHFAVKASCGMDQQQLYEASFSGKSEAKITAAVAAELAMLVMQSPQTGVMHIHDFVLDIPNFIKQLERYDRDFRSML